MVIYPSVSRIMHYSRYPRFLKLFYIHIHLASGGQESIQGAGDLGADGANPRKGGGGPKGVTDVLHRRDTTGPPLQGGVLGSDSKTVDCR